MKKQNFSYRILSAFVAVIFTISLIPPSAQAQQTILNLPFPGTMIPLSDAYMPTLVRGMTLYPENPLQFDFLIDHGDAGLEGEAFKEESRKLIKYFLATLTTPEDELWVNLSPYEQDRIIPQGLDETELGRDMLAQDYILKQLTSSLMYPEDELGGEFWDRVYAKAQEKFGTTEIPLNTFNKIWIVPNNAVVYEHKQTVYILENHLKVVLEEDYVALQNNMGIEKYGLDSFSQSETKVISGITSDVVREVLIPAIEKEVNEGKNFANLRQIYNSMLLATWYKRNLQESLLGQVYVDKKKTKGVDVQDKEIKQKIFDQYVKAFKKGVYDYIRDDFDPATQQIIPRKYFSGGIPGYLGVSVESRKTGDGVANSPVVNDRIKEVGINLLENFNRKDNREAMVAGSSVLSVVYSQNQLRKKATDLLGFLTSEQGFMIYNEETSHFISNLYTIIDRNEYDTLNPLPVKVIDEMITFVEKKLEDSKFMDTQPRDAEKYIKNFMFDLQNIRSLPTVHSFIEDADFNTIKALHSLFVDSIFRYGKSSKIKESLKGFIDQLNRRTHMSFDLNRLSFVLKAEGVRAHLLKRYNVLQLQPSAIIEKKEINLNSDDAIVEEFRNNNYFGILDLPIIKPQSINFIGKQKLEEAITQISKLGDGLLPKEISEIIKKALDTFYKNNDKLGLATVVAFEVIADVARMMKIEKASGKISPTYFDNSELLISLSDQLELELYERQLAIEKLVGRVGGQASSTLDKWVQGGVNFNPATLDLQIKRDANWVPLPMDQQPIFDMKIDGFSPVIIHVTPVNIPLLLGLQTNVCPDDESGDVNCVEGVWPVVRLDEEVVL
ncbi:hypothetical protein MNBD_UNCLBAC01-1268 [hydrothermal vent metagenome]|uniref:Uncharacterized protein n=1 Tax=hydrothermal vent metagenome TaxID=652676 RepID=A0A3B1DL28_9ZZZZ